MDYYRKLVVEKMGTLNILPTDAKHIYVGSEDHGSVVVNGVDYYLSGHIYKWEDGEWHWGPSRDQQWSEPHMHRKEPTGNRDYNPSSAAREKARELIMHSVKAWIAANPDVMFTANYEDLESRLRKANAEHKEICDKMFAKGREIADLQAQLDRFGTVSRAS